MLLRLVATCRKMPGSQELLCGAMGTSVQDFGVRSTRTLRCGVRGQGGFTLLEVYDKTGGSCRTLPHVVKLATFVEENCRAEL